MFREEYLVAHMSPKRPWLYDSLYHKIQNRAQLDQSAQDLLFDQARVAYTDYHYYLYLHGRIEFYSNARAHNAKQRYSSSKYSKTYGGGPQDRR
jgi:hypothetical protein